MMITLVAESSPQVRDQINSTLQKLGYPTANANDVLLAQDLLSLSSDPILLLLDWNLPGLLDSGLLHRLEAPNVFTVFRLPNAEIPDYLQTRYRGHFDVITGPLTEALLRIRLRNGELTLRALTPSKSAEPVPQEQLQEFTAQIAHNINTPLQFMGDSLEFLEESFKNIEHLMGPKAADASPPAPPASGKGTQFNPVEDLQTLLEEIPKAIKISQQGLSQVHQFITEFPAKSLHECYQKTVNKPD